MSKDSRTRLITDMAGAIAASLAVSTLFSLFGYSDSEEAPTVTTFTTEFGMACVSYFTGVLLFQIKRTSRNQRPYDVCGISLLGSGISWLLKLTVLDRQNGLSAYIAQITRENSFRPIGSFIADGASFIIFSTFIVPAR